MCEERAEEGRGVVVVSVVRGCTSSVCVAGTRACGWRRESGVCGCVREQR